MKRRPLSPEEILKRLKEAEGKLCDYRPFVRVGDFGSLGESARIFGKTTKREHHLLSRLEQTAFLVFDHSKKVCDIREQFPMVTLNDTLKIAKALKIKHPADPVNRFPVVMTTDFLLTLKDEKGFKDVAVCIKTKDDFKKPRTQQKLQIEKAYWRKKGIDWCILLEDSISGPLVENLKALERLPTPDPFIKEEMSVLEEMLRSHPTESLEALFLRFEHENLREPGHGYFIFKEL